MNLKRRIRWATGRGWTKEDFVSRYSARDDDAWDYSNSDGHQCRFEAILEAIPEQLYKVGLEVGCAEGQLTQVLAPRVDRLVACDFSKEAIKRAKRRTSNLQNIEFAVHDIRDGPIVDRADLIIFSDVLNYLSQKEITKVIEACSKIAEQGEILLFAKEWAN